MNKTRRKWEILSSVGLKVRICRHIYDMFYIKSCTLRKQPAGTKTRADWSPKFCLLRDWSIRSHLSRDLAKV